MVDETKDKTSEGEDDKGKTSEEDKKSEGETTSSGQDKTPSALEEAKKVISELNTAKESARQALENVNVKLKEHEVALSEQALRGRGLAGQDGKKKEYTDEELAQEVFDGKRDLREVW